MTLPAFSSSSELYGKDALGSYVPTAGSRSTPRNSTQGRSPPRPPAALPPEAERRCGEMMQAQFSDDIGLDELAAEAKLSPLPFARKFMQNLNGPPLVYQTRPRMEKACELRQHTELPVTEMALEAGYSSNQSLARIFPKHRRISPSDDRLTVRDPAHGVSVPTLATPQ